MSNLVEVCSPIKTLDKLYQIKENPPKWASLTIPIAKNSNMIKNIDLYINGYACHYHEGSEVVPVRYKSGTVPKTLVCHDMKNGYLEDRFIEGSENYSAYLFYHWATIDIFVYFSHHFITIPPLCWINVAHKHGVQILGTIITEWKDGKKICDEFLRSEDDIEKFVDHLVFISKHFKLDGWLLNIENDVDNVDMLLKFAKRLTEEMHANIPNSNIIWYDSVTNNGKLDWQNCLNHRNRDFFDVTDGIFLNYCWTKSHLDRTLQNCDTRKHDVYVGIDVWGRNFWGGGHFNTIEAVKEIYEYNFSLAIFAPAWTHEGIKVNELIKQPNITFESECDSLTNPLIRKYFLLRENAFWNTLWPYLNTKAPTELPFHSFFCIGAGEKRKYNGKVINDECWFNLREQQYQQSFPMCSKNFILELIPEPAKSKDSTAAENQNEEEIKKINVPDSQNPVNESILYENGNSTCSEIDHNVQTSSDCCERPVNETIISDNDASNYSKPPIKRFSVKVNEEETGCTMLCTSDSYYGGNCLQINPVKDKNTHENSIEPNVINRLFLCEFQCDFSFIVYYVMKSTNDAMQQACNILITTMNKKTMNISKFILCPENCSYINAKSDTALYPINFTDDKKFEKLRQNMEMTHPGFCVNTKNDDQWIVRYYYIKCPNSKMLSIDCELLNNSSPILLGGIGVAKDVTSF